MSVTTLIETQGELRLWTLDDLVLHPRPFTGVMPNRVADLVEKWNDVKCGYGLVNVRDDGSAYLLDGNHRATAKRELGQTEFLCETHYGLDINEEVELIKARGRDIRPYRQIDEIGLDYSIGEEYTTAFIDLYKERHLTLIDRGSLTNPKKVGGAGMLWKSRVDLDLLAIVLDGVIAWEASDGDKHKWNASLILAMVRVLANPEPVYGGAINPERFFRKLETVTPSTLFARAREAQSSKEAKSLVAGFELALHRRYRARGLYA